MPITKDVAGGVGGFGIAFLGAANLALVAGASMWPALFFFVLLYIGISVAGRSPSARVAWLRVLSIAAVLSLFLPVSGYMWSINEMARRAEAGVEPTTSPALGIIPAFLALLGISLAAAFVMIGMYIGKEKRRASDVEDSNS